MQQINMIMIYYWDLETQKRLHILEADIITIKKILFDVSNSKGAFLQDVYQMTASALVSVIHFNHINGLHPLWDTLYNIVLGLATIGPELFDINPF